MMYWRQSLQPRKDINFNVLLSLVIIVMSFFTSPFYSLAQKDTLHLPSIRVVNGSIPIPFVSVINMTTSKSVISDADGFVILQTFTTGDTLLLRSMGYEDVIIIYGQQRGQKIGMEESPISLKEVQITSNVVPDVGSTEGLKSLGVESIGKGVAPGNTAELLQKSGQVHVQQSQQGGGSPVLRGFEANRVLLVIDGVRMNNAIYRSGHLQNAITIDPNSLEKVQVILGPSSVRFGSDALGGVVHFTTLKPRFRSKHSEYNSSALVSTQYKSVNNSVNIHGTAEAGGERWASVVAMSSSSFGDLKMGKWRVHGDPLWGGIYSYVDRRNGVDSIVENSNPSIQTPSGYSQKDFLHKLRLGIPGGAIETNFQYSISSDIPRLDKLNDISASGLKWAEWNYGPQERLMTAVSWEQYLGIPGSLHTTFAYQNISESRKKRQFGDALKEIQEELVDVISLSSVWVSSPFRGDGWKFEAGIDGQWNDVTSVVRAEDFSGITVVDSGFGDSLLTRYPNAGSDMLSWASFASAKRNSGENIYHVGIRYSHSAINASYIPTSALELPFDEIHSSHGALTGSIAAEVPLSLNIKTTTSLSSGFRHPNIDDAAKIREKGGYVLIPNDSLRAEYIYSFDESVSWDITPRLSVNSAVFLSLWADMISPVAATLNNESQLFIDGEYATIQRNENLGNAIIKGARFEINAQILKNLNFHGVANFTKGTRLISQAPISHIPPMFGRTSIEFYKKDWSIEGFVLFNGVKNIEDYGPGGTDNPQEALLAGTPSWWTLNIESHFEIYKNIRAQVGLTNLLDMHYKTFSSGISAPGRGAFIAIHATL